MKTEKEVKQLISDIKDRIKEINTNLENVSSETQQNRLNKERRKLQPQIDILLEILK